MKANDLMPVDIYDAGMPRGINLVSISKVLSWKRRGLIVKWVKGQAPIAFLNGYRFSINGLGR